MDHQDCDLILNYTIFSHDLFEKFSGEMFLTEISRTKLEESLTGSGGVFWGTNNGHQGKFFIIIFIKNKVPNSFFH